MPYKNSYESPTELINDQDLSNAEKVKMLESWRDDKEALMRASEEGMGGEVRSEFLREIEVALTTLQTGSLDH